MKRSFFIMWNNDELISFIMDLVKKMPNEDKADLALCLRELNRTDDEEERQSLIKAIKEILMNEPIGKLSRMF